MSIPFWLFSRLGFIEMKVTERDVLSDEFEVRYINIYINKKLSDLQNIRLLNVV